MGVRPAGKRQTGVCRSSEVLTKGDLPRGMKRSGINPSAATKDSTPIYSGVNFCLCYDMGPVVGPRDDIEKTARVGGGVIFHVLLQHHEFVV